MGAPSGTVTFLFTDIEGSTRLWEAAPEVMRGALARHDELLRSLIGAHGGYVFATGGDGFAAAFERPWDAVGAALEVQRAMGEQDWATYPMAVRIGLHTGGAEERDGDYFGLAVNRAARLMAAAHGGQVVCSAVTAGLLSEGVAPGLVMVDLGEHRLRDLSAPERVFEVRPEDSLAAFPPLRSMEVFATNLPTQPGVFIGREREMERVSAAIAASPLVTLTGVGGVGKTRLAVQVAADQLTGFPDGAWLVEFAGLGDGLAVAEVAARAVGVQARGRPVAEALIEFLASRHLLLVVDNCEHVIDAATGLVEQVVRACPRVRVLATSREGLGLEAERVIPIAPLPLPGGEDFEAVSGSEAVRLFVQRAAQVRDGFTLSPANAAVVSRLCRRLDGIPLAIELAAARLRSMTPGDILDHLDDRFRLLSAGRRLAPGRQQTLRAAMDWSYDLLDGTERAVLRRLGVFAGGFDLAAAEAVAAGGEVDRFDIADALDRLVDKSLVVAETDAEHSRYRLLETIRDYAWARLEEAGEPDEVALRHAEVFATIATEAGVGLTGPEEGRWAEVVDRELDNLRSALAWSIATAQVDLAMELVAGLSVFSSGVVAPFRQLAGQVAALPAAQGHRLRPLALASAAYAVAGAGADGDMQEARALIEAAISPVRRYGPSEWWVRCRAFSAAVSVFTYLGVQDRLDEHVSEWLELASLSDQPYDLALALVAAASRRDGDVVAGRALQLARQLGNPSTTAWALIVLAAHSVDTEPSQARVFAEEAIGLAAAVRNEEAVAVALNVAANLELNQGDPLSAARAFLDIANKCAAAGIHLETPMALAGLATCLSRLGDVATASTIADYLAARGYHGGMAGSHLFSARSIELLDSLCTGPGSAGERMTEADLMHLIAESIERCARPGHDGKPLGGPQRQAEPQ